MSKTPVAQSLPNGHTPPQERARSDNRTYAADKLARVEQQVTQLNETLDKYKQVMALPGPALMGGIERWYSAAEVAEFFTRSNQWIYDRFKKGKFTYRNGDPIVPVYTGGPKKPRMRFNLDLVRALVESCYRDGIVKREELELILKRVAVSELGEVSVTIDE